jgi:outer membrane receptor for ferrienterochelin and colicin
MYKKFLFLFPLVISISSFSQENETSNSSEEEVEEVITVGSQIKGAKITGSLPVTVFSVDDIEATGASDGDELLENLVEQGMNYFNEQEQTSGGVNASRGDVGAYNMRSMGVGNTLTLLNGRRLVMNAGYQTEYIGGDFVPTMTVNTNVIPTNGLSRLEILKDGASAIYGADAVAGVVNNVMDTDYEGFSISSRVSGYEHFDAVDADLSLKYGFTMNDGATNIAIFLKERDRDRIRACDSDKWCNSDYDRLLPDHLSHWDGRGLDNRYTYGMFQIDLNSKYGDDGKPKASTFKPQVYGWTDGDGESQLFPIDHEKCSSSTAVDTGMGSCLVKDTTYYYDAASLRDYRGEMTRRNTFIFITHQMKNGMEMFGEIGRYKSKSEKNSTHGSFRGGIFSINSDYYWFSQLPEEVRTTLSGDINSSVTTSTVRGDGWRPYNKGRDLTIKKQDYRLLLGFRGTTDSNWDWESAITYSKARANDVARRIVYPKLYQHFKGDVSKTSNAFNIFDPNWLTNNGESILADVTRDDVSTLSMIDFKMSNPEVYNLPAGPIGMLVGAEWRHEEYEDDRSPYLDGQVKNSNCCGVSVNSTNNHPYSSAAMGSSPTSDVFGDKRVKSAFVEFSIPVTDKIDAQLAVRHEAFSDSDNTTVGKFAMSYAVVDWATIRASASTSFRPPNLVQVNQEEVARTGSRFDAVMQLLSSLKNFAGEAPTDAEDGAFIDDFKVLNSIRYATGAENLVPEESTNSSIGVILEPIDGLTITYDVWAIEKENTIGLFGRNNHSVYDLLLRKQAGIGGATTVSEMVTYCKNEFRDAFEGYDAGVDAYYMNGSAVRRDEYWGSTDESDTHNALFFQAGLCPVGEQDIIRDEYLNLATREVEGTDISIYYDFDTDFGSFKVTVASSITDKFYQTPIPQFELIQNEIASGALPAYFTIEGYGNLLQDSDIGTDQKDTIKVNYRYGDWGASFSALRLGEAYDKGMKLTDGTPWLIESMTTMNLGVYKKIEINGNKARIKLMIKNIADERAPLADGFLGFFSDMHRDLGRNYYLDFKIDL